MAATTRIALATSLLLLAACAVDANGVRDVARHDDGDSFRMQPGDSIDVAGDGRLRYAALVNDSRCKPDVQCIWAGDAELAFEWRPASGAMEAFSLHTGRPPGGGQEQRSHRIGDHVLALVDLGWTEPKTAQLALQAAAR